MPITLTLLRNCFFHHVHVVLFVLQVFVGNVKFEPGFVRIVNSNINNNNNNNNNSVDQSQSSGHAKSETKDDKKMLAIAISVPCFALVIAVLVTVFVCRRRKRSADAKDASLAETGSDSSQRRLTHASSCFAKLFASRKWNSFSGSQQVQRRDSFQSDMSHKLPPLPVNSIFGHDRRTTGGCP